MRPELPRRVAPASGLELFRLQESSRPATRGTRHPTLRTSRPREFETKNGAPELPKRGLQQPGQQHNVMAFVGNGFDIQVMHDYEEPVDTRYTSFYHFLKLRSFDTRNGEPA